MARPAPYRITLYLYSGLTERHHITADNYRDAFSKAHRFAVPIAMSGTDGVRFIDVKRLTKQYVADHGITME